HGGRVGDLDDDHEPGVAVASDPPSGSGLWIQRFADLEIGVIEAHDLMAKADGGHARFVPGPWWEQEGRPGGGHRAGQVAGEQYDLPQVGKAGPAGSDVGPGRG